MTYEQFVVEFKADMLRLAREAEEKEEDWEEGEEENEEPEERGPQETSPAPNRAEKEVSINLFDLAFLLEHARADIERKRRDPNQQSLWDKRLDEIRKRTGFSKWPPSLEEIYDYEMAIFQPKLIEFYHTHPKIKLSEAQERFLEYLGIYEDSVPFNLAIPLLTRILVEKGEIRGDFTPEGHFIFRG